MAKIDLKKVAQMAIAADAASDKKNRERKPTSFRGGIASPFDKGTKNLVDYKQSGAGAASDYKQKSEEAAAESRVDEPLNSPEAHVLQPWVAHNALEAALAALEREGDEPRRVLYPKTRPLPKDSHADVQDEATPLTNLQKHDKRFHPKGYKEGDSCKYREAMARGDKADDLEKAERQEAQGNLSKKKYEDYLRQMKKKHPELDAEAVLAEVGKIEDSKVQADAAAWLLRGAIRLPEDLYKVEQARDLAGKAKVDPLSYDTPQACINDLLGQGHKVSLKPITVEELKKDPLFSDYKKLPMGVETFEVEDSKAGQRRMREVIDTHWGKEANPWCLLARENQDRADQEADERFSDWWDNLSGEERNRICGTDVFTEKDEDGEEVDVDLYELDDDVVEEARHKAENYYYANVDSCYKNDEQDSDAELRTAWHYWHDTYNALPKRVAFRNGKLLAFMATDGEELSQEAKSYRDEYEDSDEARDYMDYKEWLDIYHPEANAPGEQWWDRQDSPHEGIPVGNLPVEGDKFGRWADYEILDGRPVIDEGGARTWHKGTPGRDGYIAWHDNGNVAVTVNDGKVQEFFASGRPAAIEEDDMLVRFDQDGRLEFARNWGGDRRESKEKRPLSIDLRDGKVREVSIRFPSANPFYDEEEAVIERTPGGKWRFVGNRPRGVTPEMVYAEGEKFLDKVKGRHGKVMKTAVQDATPFPKTAFLEWLKKGGGGC